MSSPSFDSGRELDAQEIVTLTDSTGRSLDCYVENEVASDGVDYVLLQPVDLPIVILAWDDDEEDAEIPETEMVEDPEELAEIFLDAKAVLSERELTLKDTAYVMTISGEIPPLQEEDILSLEIEDDEESRLEPEELQLLTDFYHLEQHYSIYTPIDPYLFFAHTTANDELEMLDLSDPKVKNLVDLLIIQDDE
ncbi:DUF3727 domain-containing protein [[Leptolyngbya] sp. PCC 7376]|uniref:DUF3727 domain-containing protein n=1 Tax=[Leptolyngbya] sp. PCC 7376 TaxID=111781 RepID=UPI0005A261E2|nr:DUF3727 domain-containing protein [[Leptolyngbya] sp. PCC 7376]